MGINTMNNTIWHSAPSLEYINGFGKNTLGENLGMEFIEIGVDYLFFIVVDYEIKSLI
ncbi:MAG: hypothetical protein RIQ73_676 [Actinomycetota bacterium]